MSLFHCDTSTIVSLLDSHYQSNFVVIVVDFVVFSNLVYSLSPINDVGHIFSFDQNSLFFDWCTSLFVVQSITIAVTINSFILSQFNSYLLLWPLTQSFSFKISYSFLSLLILSQAIPRTMSGFFPQSQFLDVFTSYDLQHVIVSDVHPLMSFLLHNTLNPTHSFWLDQQIGFNLD